MTHGVIGRGSFTARTLASLAQRDRVRLIDCRASLESADLGGLTCLLNCSFDPRMNIDPYDEDHDLDLRWARLARQADLHYVMLSSRKVYAEDEQFGACEESKVVGLDAYGRNKVETEKRLRDTLPPGKLTILRIGNLIGMEYPRDRSSLMGYMLGELASKDCIEFTQSPFSRRDCLPFEVGADAMLRIMDQRIAGTYNLGAGFATMIGEIALWLIAGYGSGKLHAQVGGAHGEFCLRVDKLAKQIPLSFSRDQLENYCLELGRSLRRLLSGESGRLPEYRSA